MRGIFAVPAGLAALIAIGVFSMIVNMRKRDGLARNLPRDTAHARETFAARVRTRLGPGTPVNRFVRVLSAEGFDVDPQRLSATYQDRTPRGRRVWKITWDVAQGQIASIKTAVGISAYG